MRPRAATSASASSSEKTPARHAATNSPMLWPSIACGLIPQLIQSWASAYSIVKMAGWAMIVSVTRRFASSEAVPMDKVVCGDRRQGVAAEFPRSGPPRHEKRARSDRFHAPCSGVASPGPERESGPRGSLLIAGASARVCGRVAQVAAIALRHVLSDHGAAARKCAAPSLKRPRNVGQIHIRVRLQMLGKIVGGTFECRFRARRKHQQLRRSGGRSRRLLRTPARGPRAHLFRQRQRR